MYNSSTNQRKVNPIELDEDVSPKDVKVNEQEQRIAIKCTFSI